jgi:hypothetical protein
MMPKINAKEFQRAISDGVREAMMHDTLAAKLEEVAREFFGGNFTVMRFGSNWRVGFGTPTDYDDIQGFCAGKTFAQAAQAALQDASCGAEGYRNRHDYRVKEWEKEREKRCKEMHRRDVARFNESEAVINGDLRRL